MILQYESSKFWASLGQMFRRNEEKDEEMFPGRHNLRV
jgi:hypothetical protein